MGGAASLNPVQEGWGHLLTHPDPSAEESELGPSLPTPHPHPGFHPGAGSEAVLPHPCGPWE